MSQCGLRGALDADRAHRRLVIDLRAVLHEEALDAREFVLLRGQDDDVEFEIGQVGAGELEARGVVGVLVTDRA